MRGEGGDAEPERNAGLSNRSTACGRRWDAIGVTLFDSVGLSASACGDRAHGGQEDGGQEGLSRGCGAVCEWVSRRAEEGWQLVDLHR